MGSIQKAVHLVALCLVLPMMWSCKPTHLIQKFIPADSLACETEPTYIYPFLEGEPINFAYSRIGKVEVVSNSSRYNDKMLAQLMQVASGKCANAVIGIYIDQVMVKDKYGLPYIRRRINGIAVRTPEDSTFNKNYARYKKDLNQKNVNNLSTLKKVDRQNWLFAVGITFSVTIIVMLGILSSNG